MRSPSAPNVAFVNPAVAKMLPLYYLIRDVLAGESAVKAATTKYLPKPDAEDKSPENAERYKQYLQRAVFYSVTRRTLNGLIGQVFMRDPVIELPTTLQVLEKNVSGNGVSLVQQAKRALSYALAYSRGGLHIDFPATEADGGLTVADMEEGKIRPTINLYSPMEIINWRTVEDGAEEKLSLVVIFETYASADDGFEIKTSGQFRVLRLDMLGNAVQQLWREPTPTNADGSAIPKGKNWAVAETTYLRGPDGSPLREIPFVFFGSENNDSSPDYPNLYDLASLNLAHYRNSADYEESGYIVGQPTIVLSGLTEDWVKDVLKGTVRFGSRGGIMLPKDANAQLLQADENTMLKEMIEAKERQMVALGAKLVEQKQVQRTATETKQEATSEGSVLSTTALNVQAAYEKALSIAAMYAGAEGATVSLKLNTEFDLNRMSPEERRQVIEEWQKGAISFKEMRDVLRKAGTATENDEAARESIAADQAEAIAQAAAAMEAEARAQAAGAGNGDDTQSGGGE